MRKINLAPAFYGLLMIPSIAFAQQWRKADTAFFRSNEQQRVIRPQKFSLVATSATELLGALNKSPLEFTGQAHSNPAVFSLPMPDGTVQQFHIFRSPVMEEALATKYPEIQTFSGQGIDDPRATLRMDYNPYYGLSAQVLGPSGRIYLDPYSRGDREHYMSYYAADYRDPVKENAGFPCTLVPGGRTSPLSARISATGPCRGTELFTYRLAVACTGEYAVAATGLSAPTVAQTLSKIVTTVNRVDGVYESEISVRLLLVSNEDQVVFTDATTDPFTGNNSGSTLIGESQTVIDNKIGNGGYDVGHTFSTGGGGLASLDVVCFTGNKAKGVTGSPAPTGDAYDIDYVAHELGHQFGANHTFNNNNLGSCTSNRNGATAFEPGSGTTIMAYAGICLGDDIQPHSDPFFHSISFDEIANALSNTATDFAGSCKGVILTGNTLPQITAMNNNGASIPKGTPFVLTASASDADGDALSYCWEEWDLGTAGSWNSGAFNNNRPLFKSRIPKNTGSRSFPDIAVILANYPSNPPSAMNGLKGETLLTGNGSTRTLKFRLTVRDNRAGGGGVVTGGEGCQTGYTGIYSIDVVTSAGPFVITAPVGGETWQGGSTQTISWNVASTNAAPVNTSNVKILMSTDGGYTYPTTILTSTPNDGTEAITVPNIPTNNTVRFRVEAVGNVFFDISDNNSTIIHTSTLPVGLMNFTVRAQTTAIDLNWETAGEQNNAGFAVERSENNAAGFTTLGFIPGAGSTQQTQVYAYHDVQVRKNIRYYYRLKQVDLDGHFSYAPIRSGIIGDGRLINVQLTPNPAREKITITLSGIPVKELSISLLDASGRLIKQQDYPHLSTSILEVDTRKLTSGVYFLRIQTGVEEKVIKFIRE